MSVMTILMKINCVIAFEKNHPQNVSILPNPQCVSTSVVFTAMWFMVWGSFETHTLVPHLAYDISLIARQVDYLTLSLHRPNGRHIAITTVQWAVGGFVKSVEINNSHVSPQVIPVYLVHF